MLIGTHFRLFTAALLLAAATFADSATVAADAHRIPVEVDKPANERGSYIHPELFGAPEEKGVQWARHPKEMKRREADLEKRSHLAQNKKP